MMANRAMGDGRDPHHHILGYAGDWLLAVIAGIGIVWALDLKDGVALVTGTATSAGTCASLWARRAGRTRPMLEGFGAGIAVALGVCLGMKWLG